MTGAVTRRLAAPLWIAICVMAVGTFFLLPIVYLVAVSFKMSDDVLTGHVLPQAPTVANWPIAFQLIPLARFIWNSICTSLLAAAATIAIVLPAIYGIQRLALGYRWLADATLASFVAPPIVVVLPFFYLLKTGGLLNTIIGLALVYAVVNVPVAFWLLAPFVRQLPREIEEAAAVDGIATFAIFVHIVIPLIAPGLIATALILTIFSYDEFLLASSLTFSDATRTLTVGISLFQGERLVNFGQMAAASLSGMVPLYILAVIGQRWLVSGLSHGGVKF